MTAPATPGHPVQAGTAHPPRLNPFAFPSETSFHFLLLMIAVLGAGLFMYQGLYFSFPENAQHSIDERGRCLPFMADSVQAMSRNGANGFQDATAATAECAAPENRTQVRWMLGGMVLLVLVSGGLYWVWPWWKIRRQRLVPYGEEDSPEIAACLLDLSRLMGLRRPPQFLLDGFSSGTAGVAFGRLGRYFIALEAGLITRFSTDRPYFRAVVLHELAHLRNGDVDMTYLALASVYAFWVVAQLPLVVALVVLRLNDLWTLANGLGFLVSMTLGTVTLTILLYVARNMILRSREAYADVRAAIVEGAPSALSRIFAAPDPRSRAPWLLLANNHPEPLDRARTLDRTDRLFHVGFWEAFSAGMAAGVAFTYLAMLLSLGMTGIWETIYPTLASVLMLTPLIVGVVGLGIWRDACRALARGEDPGRVSGLAFGLASGLTLGQMVSIQLGLGEWLSGTVGSLVWGAAVFVCLCAFLKWLQTSAVSWLPVAATSRSPRLFYISMLVLAGVTLVDFLTPLLHASRLALSGGDLRMLLFAPLMWLALVPAWLNLVALVSLWAVPLGAGVWFKRTVTAVEPPEWAFTDTPNQALTWAYTPWAYGPAVRPALALGAVACILLLVQRLLWLALVPEEYRQSDGGKLAGVDIQVGIAVVVQVVAGIVAARRANRLRKTEEGLFAAFVSGSMSALGILVLWLVLGGSFELGLAMTITYLVLSGGAAVTLLTFGTRALKGVRSIPGSVAQVPPGA